MFHKDHQGIYRAEPLERFAWLEHGFGTRAMPADSFLMPVATLRQIHSALCVPARGRSGLLGEGDALLDNTPGRLVAVKTADCVPVLLVDEEHRAVAAVHAGWRGTAAGIVRRAIDAMLEEFGTSAASIHAAIGPAIGACCYEVGAEVAARFGENGPCRIDLPDANRRQLLEAGVAGSRVYDARLCTRCGGAEFHSFRRDREQAGRMLSFAGVR